MLHGSVPVVLSWRQLFSWRWSRGTRAPCCVLSPALCNLCNWLHHGGGPQLLGTSGLVPTRGEDCVAHYGGLGNPSIHTGVCVLSLLARGLSSPLAGVPSPQ